MEGVFGLKSHLALLENSSLASHFPLNFFSTCVAVVLLGIALVLANEKLCAMS